MSELETDRLLLRRWREGDREPFAALNADPVVMEHFPALGSRGESDAMVDRIEAHFDRRGFGLWAVEVRGGAPFVGFVGLSTPTFEAHFMPGSRSAGVSRASTGAAATRPRPPAWQSTTGSRSTSSARSWRSRSPRTSARGG